MREERRLRERVNERGKRKIKREGELERKKRD